MNNKLQRLTIVEKIDLETIRNEKINFSFDTFTEVYNQLERRLMTEILVQFFDIKNPSKLDYSDFSFNILPNYTRILSYNKQDLGVINLFFEPSNSVYLPIVIQFKPL